MSAEMDAWGVEAKGVARRTEGVVVLRRVCAAVRGVAGDAAAVDNDGSCTGGDSDGAADDECDSDGGSSDVGAALHTILLRLPPMAPGQPHRSSIPPQTQMIGRLAWPSRQPSRRQRRQ